MKQCLDQITNRLDAVKSILKNPELGFEDFLQVQKFLDDIVLSIVHLEYKVQDEAEKHAPTNLCRH